MPFGDPFVLAAAVALDLVAGDPPNRLHPVAAMGWLVGRLRRLAPTAGPLRALAAGLGIIVAGVLLSAAVGVLVLVVRDHARWVGLAAEVVVLKMTFSVRGLARAATDVRRALAGGDLPEARRRLAWHLVSRDTTNLDEPRVAAAAVESVAENTSDSVVAPWFYYLLGGLPAALAYRFANTADAMLGYRDAEREWLGKVPARLDDVLNWVPARLTAALVVLVAPVVGGSAAGGVRVWRRDAGLTASPNAGRPMAAAAGVLGLELEKVGCYRLGAGGRPPAGRDVGRAVGLLYAVVCAALVVAVAAAGLPRWLG
ncbi:cobalamin biosynthesis protein CobD [bacterium]|nr:cobalamin biosynthesis protein CobD [bacterium]